MERKKSGRTKEARERAHAARKAAAALQALYEVYTSFDRSGGLVIEHHLDPIKTDLMERGLVDDELNVTP